MKNYFKFGFLSSLGVLTYIAIVAFVMMHGEQWFGGDNDGGIVGMIAILTLITISAAVMALLVFGKPVYLFLNGQKKEGLLQAVWTIGCLITEAIIFFVIAAVTR